MKKLKFLFLALVSSALVFISCSDEAVEVDKTKNLVGTYSCIRIHNGDTIKNASVLITIKDNNTVFVTLSADDKTEAIVQSQNIVESVDDIEFTIHEQVNAMSNENEKVSGSGSLIKAIKKLTVNLKTTEGNVLYETPITFN